MTEILGQANLRRVFSALRTAARLGISVLGAHQEAAGRQLSARGADRFAEMGWQATGQGAVLLCGASAWLDCSIDQEISAGDHDIVLLRVHDLDSTDTLPLVFHGSSFRQLQVPRRSSECARTVRPTAAPEWAAHGRHDRLDPVFGLAHPHA